MCNSASRGACLHHSTGRSGGRFKTSDAPGQHFMSKIGGIWAGISGSPVYIGGKLLGAVRNNTPPHRVEFIYTGGPLAEGFGAFGMGVRITTGTFAAPPVM